MYKLLIITLLFSISINAQTFINQDLDGNINLETNIISIKLKDDFFKGTLTPVKYKYKNYYLIKGDSKQLLIAFENLKSKRETKISELIILAENYNEVIKDIEQKTFDKSIISFEYNYMFDASKNKELNTTWKNKDYFETQNKLKSQYSIITDLENFEGKYYVKILKSGGLNYSELNYKAELYISNEGFTFKSEIPSVMLLRGTHYIVEDFLPTQKGYFILTKGNSKKSLVSLNINSEKKAGAFSFKEYGEINTTTFIIEKFVN